MKIAIWLPNLTKNCGGAETYALNMANILRKSHDVIFITSNEKKESFDINKVYDRFDSYHFKTVYIDYVPIRKIDFRKFYWDKIYDRAEKEIDNIILKENINLFINATYGKLKGNKRVPSIHIIHFPAEHYKYLNKTMLDKEYINSYDYFIANSQFTRKNFSEMWKQDSVVLYPPIKMEPIEKSLIEKKEDIILAVDRLVPDKKILEMVHAFKQLKAETNTSYKFVIIGSRDANFIDYFNKIIKEIKDTDIQVLSGLPFNELANWYKKSKIFWHAKGYGETNPFAMEHFGMTTVEAMANGCVPVVINKAGQIEIVDESVNGYKWNNFEELLNKTKKVMDDKMLRYNMQLAAIEKSREYLLPTFSEKLEAVIKNVEVN